MTQTLSEGSNGDIGFASQSAGVRARPCREVLCATDLSVAAAKAVRRAAKFAAEQDARLTLVHPVEDPHYSDQFEYEISQVSGRLALGRSPAGRGIRNAPGVLVRAGQPLQVIREAAEQLQADLIVLQPEGDRTCPSHRKLAASLPRVAARPTLLVNQEPRGPYRNVLLALDLAETSRTVVRVASSWGLLQEAAVTVVHAFTAPYEGALSQFGVGKEQVRLYSERWREARIRELREFIGATGLDATALEYLIQGATPLRAIQRAVQRVRPDLLIVGTRGYTGLKLALFGSVAGGVIRERSCDVLIVPKAGVEEGAA